MKQQLIKINATSSKGLEKMISTLWPGQKRTVTFRTAEFIRDSGMYTGNRFRDLQYGAIESEFVLNGNYYTLIWPDSCIGIAIQGGSDFE